ncbi:flagellar hook-associated protein FlgK [Clostridium brassicae]|uniref:Flagellar hook-associated protein 1 n=1 Tax=Clostridium brassicae TaxID=2999072 RepID=A0ABT4DB73_9CLOT|nr:flagellar hook-associated protein FlgK [Clostridium brassicae]MCY6959545.1 flagellar hook-associated protein FlgK [Clostridium brassicae]
MSGLFGTFNIGKRGLFAQQRAIDVTSHNIGNANTEGYSRQRAILETTRPFGMPSMDSQIGPGQIGTGVDVSTIQRVRDGFMDYQVRREKSTLGQYQARDKYLSEIESIFNEPSENGISNLIGKFFQSWDELSKQAANSNARTVVAQQSAALANELNHTYSQLEKVKENAHDSIKQTVFEVNGILERLDKLNQQIMSVKVSGMEPNDLMDQRDLLLDQLSENFNIKVENDKFYSVNVTPGDVDGLGSDVNGLLVRKNPNDAVRRFSYVTGMEKIEGKTDLYKVTYLRNGDKDKPETITVKMTEEEHKRLDQTRVLWSQKDPNNEDKDGLIIDKNGGEITSGSTKEFKDLAIFALDNDEDRGCLKGYMSVQKDVDNYMDQLNKLAKSIALSVNTIHSGHTSAGVPTDPIDPSSADYMPFFVNKDKAKYENDKINNLGDVLTGEAEITAKNIAVNEEILKDVMKIKTRIHDDQFAYAKDNDIDGESDGKRALAISELKNTLMKIQDIDPKKMTREEFIKKCTGKDGLVDDVNSVKTIKSDINGMKTDNYFKDCVNKLGIQEQEARRVVKNQEVLLKSFQERRDSISGVSLDEEMANLVQFQHAYQANAKIISTVDELLDVVINGLKR